MSDYTKSVDFAIKDGLPSGNPAKVIKGTEIDTEYNNIAIASATKLDSNNGIFTGTLTGPDLIITNSITATIDGGSY